MNPGFYLGPTGDSGIQEESNERGGNVLVAEEKKGKSRGVQEGNSRFLSLSSHGKNTLNSPAKYQGSRLW